MWSHEKVTECKVTECKGRVYRFFVGNSQSLDGDIMQVQRFRLLKRQSCPGCPECGWMKDVIKEDCSLGTMPDTRRCQHGKRYRLCCNGDDAELFWQEVRDEEN